MRHFIYFVFLFFFFLSFPLLYVLWQGQQSIWRILSHPFILKKQLSAVLKSFLCHYEILSCLSSCLLYACIQITDGLFPPTLIWVSRLWSVYRYSIIFDFQNICLIFLLLGWFNYEKYFLTKVQIVYCIMWVIYNTIFCYC